MTVFTPVISCSRVVYARLVFYHLKVLLPYVLVLPPHGLPLCLTWTACGTAVHSVLYTLCLARLSAFGWKKFIVRFWRLSLLWFSHIYFSFVWGVASCKLKSSTILWRIFRWFLMFRGGAALLAKRFWMTSAPFLFGLSRFILSSIHLKTVLLYTLPDLRRIQMNFLWDVSGLVPCIVAKVFTAGDAF